MKPSALHWIERFGHCLALERRMSSHTQSGYRRDLVALVAFCDRSGVEDWPALDTSQVRTFAARAHARGLAPQSVQRQLSAVRTFQNFLIREGVLMYNTARDVQAPKAARPLPDTLNVDEMTQLIDRPEGIGPLFVRDRAIMELFYSSGLRLAELVGLNLADIDLHDRTVRVLGKGSRERIVPVGRMAASALRQYLVERKRQTNTGETALFLGRRGQRLGPREVQFRVALWARKAGITRHVTPHMFRHSCATHLLESSSGIREVQEFLGHASISTTAIYTHLNFQHLATAYFAAHPRAEQVARGESPVAEPVAAPVRRDHHVTTRRIHERHHTTNESLA